MILPAAPRRPSRVAAAALLLALHAAAIWTFLHLSATRDRADGPLLQVVMLDVRRPAPATTPLPEARPLRPLVAPLPPVLVDAPERLPAAALPSPAPAAPPATPALDLRIPQDFRIHAPASAPPLTPAQEAMRDPRSNHLELTRQEKMDIAFGSVECIAWQREPDGTIYRGPGHLRRIQGVGTNPFTSHKPGTEDRPMECVK